MTARRFPFPREFRLLTAEQYRRVYRRGGYASAGALRARMAGNGRGHGRLGMAVGVKAAGGAVARNRIRRQVRESFRVHQHQLAGLDIVVSLPRLAGGRRESPGRALPRLWGAVVRKAGARGKWNG